MSSTHCFLHTEIVSRCKEPISHGAYFSILKHQMQAIKHVMQGNDVFVSLPTGSGKSLIYMYAVLPFAYDELLGSEGSFVSPLLSLFVLAPALCVCITVSCGRSSWMCYVVGMWKLYVYESRGLS